MLFLLISDNPLILKVPKPNKYYKRKPSFLLEIPTHLSKKQKVSSSIVSETGIYASNRIFIQSISDQVVRSAIVKVYVAMQFSTVCVTTRSVTKSII